MGKYRAIALDLDGTLMSDDKKLPARNRDTIWRAIDKGAAVILASGRPIFGVMPVANELELSERGGYVLAYNGGNIWDCRAGKMMYSKTVPQHCIPVLCDVAKKYDVAALTYYENLVISERDDDEYVLKEAFCNSAKTMHVDNLAEFVTYPECKVLLVGPHDKLLPAQAELSETFAEELSMIFSMDYFLEAVPKGIGKDVSLAELLRQLGIKREELIAFGDGLNDIDMIKYAGLGVAMENAYAPVKEAADIIAPSNMECGVAQIIEKYFEV